MKYTLKFKFIKFIAYTVFLSTFFSLSSCKSYYQVDTEVNPTDSRLTEFKNQGKYLIIHNESVAYKLTDFNLTGDLLTGKTETLPKEHRMYNLTFSDKKNPYKAKNKVLLNEVHIYTTQQLTNNEILKLPLSSITKVEVYNKNKNATTKSYIFGGIGIAAGIYALLALLLILVLVIAWG